MSAGDGSTTLRPRIRWGRMAALHFSGAFLVMVGYLCISDPSLQALRLIPIGTLPVLLGGALPPYFAAVIVWWLSRATGRGRVREVIAVAVGALVGSLVPLALLQMLLLPADTIAILVASIAGCSAVGFVIWVLVAWRPRPTDAEPGEHSLN